MKKTLVMILLSMLVLTLVSCKKKEEPPRQSIVVEDSVFKNETFGITMDIEPSWIVNAIELKENTEVAGYIKLLDVSKNWNEDVDADALNPRLTISAEKITATDLTVTAEEKLTQSLDILKTMDEQFVGAIETVTLNGTTFSYSKNRMDADPLDAYYVDNIIYSIVINDYYVSINGYYNEKDGGEQAILDMLASLTIQ